MYTYLGGIVDAKIKGAIFARPARAFRTHIPADLHDINVLSLKLVYNK